jgi:hypothetical protein
MLDFLDELKVPKVDTEGFPPLWSALAVRVTVSREGNSSVCVRSPRASLRRVRVLAPALPHGKAGPAIELGRLFSDYSCKIVSRAARGLIHWRHS